MNNYNFAAQWSFAQHHPNPCVLPSWALLLHMYRTVQAVYFLFLRAHLSCMHEHFIAIPQVECFGDPLVLTPT